MKETPSQCAECRVLLGGHVLGALEPEEELEVERHVADCPECARERDELARLPVLLDCAGPATEPRELPSPALEEAVLDRFARERPHERPAHPSGRRRQAATVVRDALARLRRPVPAAIAGALAAAAIVLGVELGGSGAPGESYQARLVGVSQAHGATAFARLVTRQDGTVVHLRVRGLHSSPGDIYEVWCIRDDGDRVTAGTFRVDRAGTADVALTTAALPDEYHHMTVDEAAAAAPPRRVLAGSIEYR